MVGFIEEPVVGFLVGSVKGFLDEEIGGLKINVVISRLTFKCSLSVYLYDYFVWFHVKSCQPFT